MSDEHSCDICGVVRPLDQMEPVDPDGVIPIASPLDMKCKPGLECHWPA